VRVTHRFHPLSGRSFEFVEHRHNWGEDRVYLRDDAGVLIGVPAGWTDLAPPDPFVVIAAGRCPFPVGALVALAALIEGSAAGPAEDHPARDVKEITP